MSTKLTLVLEKEIIEKAKDYAKDKNRSLSNIVENYLKSLIQEKKQEVSKMTPRVRSLRGSFNLPENFDYKSELVKAIQEKHL